MPNRKSTGFDSAVVTSSGHSPSTLHSIQFDAWKKIFLKMINEMFSFLLLFPRHSAFIANPKEITVNNFASTFDNTDHSSQINGLSPEWCSNSEFAFSRIAQIYCILDLLRHTLQLCVVGWLVGWSHGWFVAKRWEMVLDSTEFI